MKEKKQIENTFLEVVFLFLSFIMSFIRSIKLFFIKNTQVKKKNIFFETLNFIFRIWPKYFWKQPSLYKLCSFPSHFLHYIMKK